MIKSRSKELQAKIKPFLLKSMCKIQNKEKELMNFYRV